MDIYMLLQCSLILVVQAVSASLPDQCSQWMQVVGQLAGKYSEQQLRQTVGFLADDGAIYSTIDDIHFKACV